jgi:hypothetical protein
VFHAELGAQPALAPLLTLPPCGSHTLRLIRLSLRMASLLVAAALGALARPAPLPIGRWPRTMAEADGQFWLFPLELHPRRLPLRSEFLNIWYANSGRPLNPFHAMVSLATGRSSATLPLAPRSRLFQLIDRLFWRRTIFPGDPPARRFAAISADGSNRLASTPYFGFRDGLRLTAGPPVVVGLVPIGAKIRFAGAANSCPPHNPHKREGIHCDSAEPWS